MQLRVLIVFVLIAGWVPPAGADACPPDAAQGVAHSHAADHGGREHAHTHDDHSHGRRVAHDHAAAPESPQSGPDAPTGMSICCSDSMGTPTHVASALNFAPRSKPILLALPSRVLSDSQPASFPSAARFRLRQPVSQPFARTRRPLLI